MKEMREGGREGEREIKSRKGAGRNVRCGEMWEIATVSVAPTTTTTKTIATTHLQIAFLHNSMSRQQ
jgi:hypothetical protein